MHVDSHPVLYITRVVHPVLFTLIMVCLCFFFIVLVSCLVFFSISIYNYFYSVLVSSVYVYPNMKGVSDITKIINETLLNKLKAKTIAFVS